MVALAGYDFCVACTADIDAARERFSVEGFATCLDEVR